MTPDEGMEAAGILIIGKHAGEMAQGDRKLEAVTTHSLENLLRVP